MKVDPTTVDAISAAGIDFVANVRVPGGGSSIVLTPADVVRFSNAIWSAPLKFSECLARPISDGSRQTARHSAARPLQKVRGARIL